MISLAVILMRTASEHFRGRVMGVRMLVIYSLPIGLLAAGSLIDEIGFRGDRHALRGRGSRADARHRAALARRSVARPRPGEREVTLERQWITRTAPFCRSPVPAAHSLTGEKSRPARRRTDRRLALWSRRRAGFGVPYLDRAGGVVQATDYYPGVPVAPGSVTQRRNVLDGIRILLRPYFGAVAPREVDFVDLIPPSYFSGNLDHWRLGQGIDGLSAGLGAGRACPPSAIPMPAGATANSARYC